MAATAVPLPPDQVARRIAEQEAKLQALYEARTKHLEALNRRKQSLQTQLEQIDAQIAAYSGKAAARKAAPSKPAAKVAPPARPTAPAPAVAKAMPSLSVPQLLLLILEQAGRPLTNKELTEEVRRRKSLGESPELLKQITTRVGERVKKRLLRRTKDEKAVMLPTATPAKSATPVPKAPPAITAPKPPPPKAPATSAGSDSEQPSLQSVLTRILEKSAEPVGGAELARRAVAAGYKSKSKDFTGVVWVMLGKMKNVENIRGKGYRLKKRPG